MRASLAATVLCLLLVALWARDGELGKWLRAEPVVRADQQSRLEELREVASGPIATPAPARSGEPADATPPRSGQPADATPPRSGQPADATPPRSGQPADATPPRAAAPAPLPPSEVAEPLLPRQPVPSLAPPPRPEWVEPDFDASSVADSGIPSEWRELPEAPGSAAPEPPVALAPVDRVGRIDLDASGGIVRRMLDVHARLGGQR